MKKNGKPNKPQIEGLRLWEVEVAFKNYIGHISHRTLLITTPTESLKRAIQKAEVVLRRKRFEWRQGKVSGIERKGELDA